jgi:hypothetical protein
MNYAIELMFQERDTYLPTTANWHTLDKAAQRLCRRRDRFAETAK